MRSVYALLLCLAVAGAARGGQVLEERVEHRADRYTLVFDVLIHARENRVRVLLTDYQELTRVNPSIKEVALLSRPEEKPLRMRVVTQFCIWFFCKTLTHVQTVEDREDGAIIATFVPEMSDFRYGRMVWHILPADDSTRLQLRGDLVPAFWIPPVIGPLLVERTLRAEALETASAIENMARTR
jgi:polyketide cyclase/dehydrase/lipid transport protein